MRPADLCATNRLRHEKILGPYLRGADFAHPGHHLGHRREVAHVGDLIGDRRGKHKSRPSVVLQNWQKGCDKSGRVAHTRGGQSATSGGVVKEVV